MPSYFDVNLIWPPMYPLPSPSLADLNGFSLMIKHKRLSWLQSVFINVSQILFRSVTALTLQEVAGIAEPWGGCFSCL